MRTWSAFGFLRFKTDECSRRHHNFHHGFEGLALPSE